MADPLPPLVIGYGNPLRGDDGIGWLVAERLAAETAGQTLDVFTSHQLLPEMADAIWERPLVVFVDAAVGGKPGRFAVEPLAADTAGAVSSHHMSAEALLAYTQELYGRAPAACMVTIFAEQFDLGEPISPQLMVRLPEIVQKIILLTGQTAPHVA